MDHAFLMGHRQRPRRLAGNLDGVLDLHRAGSDDLVEALSLDKGHGDEGFAIGLVDFINGADIGMIERRGRLGLTNEAAVGVLVLEQVGSEELQGHETVELCVLGLVDHAHPALADFLDDFVMRNGLADHRRRGACRVAE